MTEPRLSEVLAALEAIAPLHLAEAWDNVGLLLEPRGGDPTVQRALLTIDLTEPVLDEALASGADLVVAYHPPIFAPLKRLTQGEAGQRTILRAAAAGIAVWSPHTALDAVPGGVNDWMLGLAGTLTDVAPIAARPDEPAAGPGRLARLREPAPLDTLVARFKEGLALPSVRLARGADAPIGTLAVCPGAGGSLFEGIRADLLVTGEMRHHDVLAHVARGMSVILTEHTNCERGYLPHLAERLRAACPALLVDVSTRDRDPLAPA